MVMVLPMHGECKDWIQSNGKGMGSDEGHQKKTKSKHVTKAEEAAKGEGTSKEPQKAEEAAENASKGGTPSSKGGNEKEKNLFILSNIKCKDRYKLLRVIVIRCFG
eukprot:56587_1